MRYLVKGTQMKEIDRFTITQVGIPSLVLMERAALAVAEEADRAAGPGGRILAAAGLGDVYKRQGLHKCFPDDAV